MIVSNGDPLTLLTKAGSFSFADEELTSRTKDLIESAKCEVRKQKLDQLYNLLGISSDQAKSIASHKGKRISMNEAKPIAGIVSTVAHDPSTEDVEPTEPAIPLQEEPITVIEESQ